MGAVALSSAMAPMNVMLCSGHLWLVACLRHQDKQNDAHACNDVGQPGIRCLIDKAKQKWRKSEEDAGDKIKDQMVGHRDELEARDAQFIVRQQAVENQANAQHHRNNDRRPANAEKAKDEWSGDQANTPDVIEVRMDASRNETKRVHNNPFFWKNQWIQQERFASPARIYRQERFLDY